MGLRPKNKDHANFYECCDLTKKVCLIVHTAMIIFGFEKKNSSFRGHLQGLVSVICIMCDLPKITLFLDFRALWSVRMSSSLALLAWKTYYIYYATNNPPPPPIPLPPAHNWSKSSKLSCSLEFTEKCENSVKMNLLILL